MTSSFDIINNKINNSSGNIVVTVIKIFGT